MPNNTRATETADALALAAAEFAAVRIDTARNADVTLAAIALRAPGSDALLADAIALASAEAGEGSKRDTFAPSDAVPTFDEFLRLAAKRAPYAISAKTVGNLRNARRFLAAAKIDTSDALALADAKRIVSKSAKAVETLAPRIAAASDPVAALAIESGAKASQSLAAAERRDAKADDARAKREADPVGYALAGLLAKAEGDAAALYALAGALQRVSDQVTRAAKAAAGGAAVIDPATGYALAE